jgi:hypothetical protein
MLQLANARLRAYFFTVSEELNAQASDPARGRLAVLDLGQRVMFGVLGPLAPAGPLHMV